MFILQMTNTEVEKPHIGVLLPEDVEGTDACPIQK